ncbi:T9SS type B sorting domain-containing protein [Flavobacterium taihuense]|uniref:T9SS type B sorting domain-containing protein n=1 Tax=Flavobacterium taihuense TaxID=2857508 RepID=A0ABS6XW80_9FLAO|nr:choice-of-anchor L domain-containing protein [Flavobacterium taihuense]MBW4360819.1 T9SS type B sorting domain-containing protein [Flavobacterium taihuense]
MNGIKNILFLVLYFLCTVASAQYITVDDTQTAQQLIENVLVNSSCANVSNFSATGDTFTTGQNSYGYFNSGISNFPIKEGVLIATSSSKKARGPYISDLGNGSDSWVGDIDLDQTLGINSINATVLEFDFVPLTNFISFNYIFASNEYQSFFPCNYSDGFAFLIKEQGSTDGYTNIAVLPGTTIPVSSKNVHPTIKDVIDPQNNLHPGCPAINDSYFNGFNTDTSPVNYSGQTVPLRAQADVIIGKTYHIKLVIADDKAVYYDSAIFLEAGSFSAKLDLGPDRTSATSNPLCFGEIYTIDTKLPANYTYEWYKDGSTIAMIGETMPTLNITTPGTYKVKVTLFPTTCTAEDEIKIEYAPQIVLNDTTLSQCDDDNDGFSVYDLTKVDNLIKNNNPKLSKVVYYTSFANAQGEINPILDTTTFKNTTINQTLYARVTNEFDCVNYAQLNLKISNNSIAIQNPIESCDTDGVDDGITQFDLNLEVTPQVINGLTAGFTVEYYLTETDAIAQKNQIPNLFSNTIPNQQTIYARIVNGPDCYNITPETLVINTFDPPNFQEETFFLCDGTNKILTVDSGFSDYLWSNGDTTNTTNVSTPGEYIVTVSNTSGCKKTKKYIVKPSGIATITSAAANGFTATDNTVKLFYTGTGNYEFSLDGNFYQDSPIFNNVNAGVFWATAKDKNGCGISIPYKVYVLDYPRFFTPNNDGYNDTWKVKNLDVLPKSSITLFDRYGKLLKQLNDSSSGWNGTFNGNQLPADDYWFAITIEDGTIIKGHFSLKR